MCTQPLGFCRLNLSSLLFMVTLACTSLSAQPTATRYALDPSFVSPALRGPVYGELFTFPLSDGGVLVAGGFEYASGARATGWTQLDQDGRYVRTAVGSGLEALGYIVGKPLLEMPDGSILFSASKESDVLDFLKPVELRRVRLNGEVDSTFAVSFTPRPGSAASLHRVAALPDGRIFVSGQFQRAGNHATRNAAFLRMDGSVFTSFASTTELVTATVDQRGRVAGTFLPRPGQAFSDFPLYGLVRLDPTGTEVDRFELPNGVRPSSEPVVDSQDRLLIAVQRGLLVQTASPREPASLSDPDPTKFPQVLRTQSGRAGASLIYSVPPILREDIFETSATMASIVAIHPQSDGGLLLVGEFPQMQAGQRTDLIRLTPALALDPAFRPSFSEEYTITRLQPSGPDWIAASTRRHNGSPAHSVLLRLDDAFTPISSFFSDLRANATVTSVYPLPGGAHLLEGGFTRPDGRQVQRHVALRENGVLDFLQVPHPVSREVLEVLHVGRDGWYYLGRPVSPNHRDNVSHSGRFLLSELERYAANGARDQAFGRRRSRADFIHRVHVDAQGRVVVGGAGRKSSLAGVPGETVTLVERLLPSGTPDASFHFEQPSAKFFRIEGIADLPLGGSASYVVAGLGQVYPISETGGLRADLTDQRYQADFRRLANLDGNAYALGAFDSTFGVRSPGIVRLTRDGFPDPHWYSNHHAFPIEAVQALTDGRFLISGSARYPEFSAQQSILTADGLVDRNETLSPFRLVVASTDGSIHGFSPDGVIQRYRTVARPTLEIAVDPGSGAPEEKLRLHAVLSTGVQGELEWLWNGALLPGQNGMTVELNRSPEGGSGVYTLKQTFLNGQSVYVSRQVSWPRSRSRIANVSARSFMGEGDRLQIVGFVGEATIPTLNPFLLRSIRSDLQQFGVQQTSSSKSSAFWINGRLSTPQYHGKESVGNAVLMAGAFPSFDLVGNPAHLLSLSASVVCTHHAWANHPGETGVGLTELYLPADAPGPVVQRARLLNFSCRAEAGEGERSLIVGFVIQGAGPLSVLLQGVGPTLRLQGLTDVTSDPAITLFRNEDVIATNDDWDRQANASAVAQARERVHATPLAAGSLDSALLVDLAPGAYTIVLRAKDQAGRLALLEIYDAGSVGH